MGEGNSRHGSYHIVPGPTCLQTRSTSAQSLKQWHVGHVARGEVQVRSSELGHGETIPDEVAAAVSNHSAARNPEQPHGETQTTSGKDRLSSANKTLPICRLGCLVLLSLVALGNLLVAALRLQLDRLRRPLNASFPGQGFRRAWNPSIRLQLTAARAAAVSLSNGAAFEW